MKAPSNTPSPRTLQALVHHLGKALGALLRQLSRISLLWRRFCDGLMEMLKVADPIEVPVAV